jgi:hypothetical protein
MTSKFGLRCLTVGCGLTLIQCSSISPPEEQTASSQSQALLGVQATGAGTQAGYIQSESVMAGAYYGSVNADHWYDEIYLALAYNDFTNVPGGCIAPNTSLMGWSLSHTTTAGTAGDAGTWVQKGQVAPLTSWPILWGDPAIANSRANQRVFFMSNLAVPATAPQLVNNGCVDDLGTALAGACIARSTDNAETFAIRQCLSDSGHFYDGSSMDTGVDGEVFAAYRDVNTSKIDVWCAINESAPLSPIADPFAAIESFPGNSMASHPRIRTDYLTKDLYAVAQALMDKKLYITHYTHRPNDCAGSWSTPKAVSDEAQDNYAVITLSDRSVGNGPEFAFDIGAPSGDGTNDDIRFMYTVAAGTGRTAVHGAACDRALVQCHKETGWRSETAGPGGGYVGNQFHPTVKAFPGFLPWYTATWSGTYFSTENNPSGNVVSLQKAAPIYFGTTPFLLKSQQIADQTPCTGTTTNGGYWSDYDDLQIAYVSPSTGVKWITSFPDSDSAYGACVQSTVTGKPIHTSTFKFSNF